MAFYTVWIILFSAVTLSYSHDKSDEPIYHNQFAVHVPQGIEAADKIAQKYGFNNIGQIGDLDEFYLFEHRHVHKRSIEPSDTHHANLNEDPQVLWVEQQVERKRVKRTDPPEPRAESSPSRSPRQLFNPFRSLNFFRNPRPNVQRDVSRRFPDPLYRQQWYLEEGASGGFDMNVLPAWQKGYTGKGVVISILDDGIQHNHPDLKQNYDPLASTDINDNDHDPMPRDNGDNRHGTRCAGEVAAVAFNNYCGVGVAYNSSIGGVRMLDGTVNDAVEARAISLNPNHIDIYSASWGPEDDGKTVDGPGPLAKRAFINGAIRGRNGKGSIFVWASGNGGRHTDNCNCDGYTNSIFTLSISSASQRGFKPWYLEECSSTLSSTYSSGTPGLDRSVATVDMDGNLRPEHVCTVEHTGTSASAPIAAGIVALTLEANPDLTWRDMQHLVVRASRMAPLAHEDGWFSNGVGRKVSHKFGYGLIDAGEMVRLAERWVTVPPQHVCQTAANAARLTIGTVHGASVTSSITTDSCAGTSGEVRYLEHVQAKVTLRFAPRGNINLQLVSPSGTTSTLLFERPRDILSEKFDEWPFLSVHYWGEKAVGTWHLIVTNSGSRPAHQPGVLVQWQLVLHGTKEHPEKLRSPGPPTNGPAFTNSQNVFSSIPNFRFSNGPFNDQILSGSNTNAVSVPIQDLQRGDPNKDNSVGDNRGADPPSYPNSSDVCHSECAGGCYAEGPNNCRRCKHANLQGECVSNCPDDTYKDDNNVCQVCHESCTQCVGPHPTQCRSCHSDTLFVTHLGLCVEVCPLSYYASNNTCMRCGGQCSECSSAGHCTKCDHSLLLHNGSCLTACPPQFYETQDNQCAPCSAPCATCVGRGPAQCASCDTHLFLTRGRCVRRCPVGTYPNTSDGTCSNCRPGCNTCKTDSICTTCKQGWRLKGNSCVAHKPDRCAIDEYLSPVSQTCSHCSSYCASCIGGKDTECLFCPPSKLLFISSCVDHCPSGYFPSAGRCLPCPDTCVTCSSSSSCTSCAPRYVLHANKCEPSCPGATYKDRGTCQQCHSSCSSCWGPAGHHCATCSPNHHLLDSRCYASCPEGYFAEDGECRPCYHNCNTCNGSDLGACLSCGDGLTLDGGLCLECSSGQYFNSTSKSCLHCEDTCLTCTSHSHTCTSCQSPLSLHIASATCRPCCQQRERGDHCCQCDRNTGKCFGGASADKRRIALSPEDENERANSSHSDLFTAVTLCVGIFNAILLTALIVTAYRCKRVPQNRKSSLGYSRLPVSVPEEDLSTSPFSRYSETQEFSDSEEMSELLSKET